MKMLAILLTVIFVIAKLFNIVTWSWWIVFAPVIVWVILYIIALMIVIISESTK